MNITWKEQIFHQKKDRDTSEDTKILEFNQYHQSDAASFAIYADHEFSIEKTDGCKNNPEKFIHNKSKRTYSIRFLNVSNVIL